MDAVAQRPSTTQPHSSQNSWTAVESAAWPSAVTVSHCSLKASVLTLARLVSKVFRRWA